MKKHSKAFVAATLFAAASGPLAHAETAKSDALANGAQSAAPATDGQPAPALNPNPDQPTVQQIVVTGSSIKRINTETASPVEVLSATELRQSGYDTVAEVLSTITANGAGTLSSNNSEAFAGGASGVALRGLSVGDTLVLVDGHRLAPYPLSDDGERQFVDINSIPFDAVERVEVLKDGASSIYGSDAIAGVVNVILKKEITGFSGMAEGGDSQHGGGASQHLAFSAGFGHIIDDGFNAYVSVEYRHQDQINVSQRSYQDWTNLNFTPLGGINLTPGAANPLNNNMPATLTPYYVNPNGSPTSASSYAFTNPGCNFNALMASQCTYASPYIVQAPTQNLNILASATKEFAGGWQLNVKASLFDSQGQQNGIGYETYPGPSYGGQVSNPINGIPLTNIGAIPNYVLPASAPGNTTGSPAYLEGVIPGVGLETLNFDSKTYRLSADLSGKLWGWDVSADLGASQVDTHVKYDNFVNYDNLYTALSDGTFNPGGGNSQSVVDGIAPRFSDTALDSLAYIELHATRNLVKIDNFDLDFATGFETVYKDLHNPSAAPILSGAVGGTFSTYAIGSQTDVAGYAEVDATVLKQIELSASFRYDYYNTYGSSVTPKFGIKWRPNKVFALRGTYSQGFRAPTAAETGTSSTVFGLGLNYPDPILCGSDNGAAAGQVPASCGEQPGFVQRTNPLKPETSTSETAGIIFEPVKGWVSTFDFYNIEIDNQIVSASELSSFSLANACIRGADLPISGVSTGVTGPDGQPILTTATPLVGPIAFCETGYVNANTTKTNGVDFDTSYRFKLPFQSSLTAGFGLSYILTYNLTAGGVTYQLAGTHGPSGVSGDTGNPQERLNWKLAFDRGPLDVSLTGYRIGSYSVTDPSVIGGADATCQGALLASTSDFFGAASAPSQFCRVKAFTDFNLAASYKLTSNLTLTGSITNLFDANAPRDFQTYGGAFFPYNPALHMDGVVGRYFLLGVRFRY